MSTAITKSQGTVSNAGSRPDTVTAKWLPAAATMLEHLMLCQGSAGDDSWILAVAVQAASGCRANSRGL